MKNEKNYYSQAGQDSIISQFFNKKNIKNGFLVDVGSIDGIHYSNTYLLEQLGWKGICVEAHPTYYPMLIKNRPNCHCYGVAAGNEDKDNTTFYANYLSSLSTLNPNINFNGYGKYYGNRNKSEIDGAVNGKITVPMKKIDTLLEKHKDDFEQIELMTIDVDGSESYVFEGLDLGKWSPRLLILEHSVVPTEIHNYATKYGYHKGKIVGADTFYCRDEKDVIILKNLTPIGTQLRPGHPIQYV
tara:strand:+ start:704 stop:1432 length:729 start_codon:yes stop_codon:yes gene_type:complete